MENNCQCTSERSPDRPLGKRSESIPTLLETLYFTGDTSTCIRSKGEDFRPDKTPEFRCDRARIADSGSTDRSKVDLNELKYHGTVDYLLPKRVHCTLLALSAANFWRAASASSDGTRIKSC